MLSGLHQSGGDRAGADSDESIVPTLVTFTDCHSNAANARDVYKQTTVHENVSADDSNRIATTDLDERRLFPPRRSLADFSDFLPVSSYRALSDNF